MTSDINLLAVLAGTVIYMIVGALWYSPLLFAKPWMKAMGKSEMQMKAGAGPVQYLEIFLCELIAVYVLAHFIYYADAHTAVEGVVTAALAWIGFTATTGLATHTFAGRSKNQFRIEQSYHLVGLAIAGAILAVWK